MNEVINSIRFPYGSVNPDFFGFPVSPLPKTLDKFGVICSPLGRRATVDTIVFRCPIDYDGESFSFWLGRNIEVCVYQFFQNTFLEVRVFSLTKFVNGRSSSLIGNYHAVLLALNGRINSELKKRRVRLLFDAFTAEVIRLDLFVDLRFKSNPDLRRFYHHAKELTFPALPCESNFSGGFYRHNGFDLASSTELLKLYFKEKNGRDKYKLRWECSMQNKFRSKPLNDFTDRIDQPETSNAVKVGKSVFVYENKFKSNAFTLLNQFAIDAAFGFVSGGRLTS